MALASDPREAEPLLDDNKDRYCMFPAEDAALSVAGATREWARLEPEQQGIVARLLAFCAASDQLLGVSVAGLPARSSLEGWGRRAQAEGRSAACGPWGGGVAPATRVALCRRERARAFYSFQIFKQGVHTEALSGLLVASLGGDEGAAGALVKELLSTPAVRRKLAWVQARAVSAGSFAERLVALAAAQSLFFCSAFAAFYALKRGGRAPTLAFLADMVSRDEGINVEGAAAVYALLRRKLPRESMVKIVEEAAAIEAEAAGVEGMDASALGLPLGQMREARRAPGAGGRRGLGCTAARDGGVERVAPLFGARNPFEWLEDIGLSTPQLKPPAGGSRSATGLTKAQAGAPAAAAAPLGGRPLPLLEPPAAAAMVGSMAAAAGPAGGLVFDEDF
eukprot:scaffold19.g1873.t1